MATPPLIVFTDLDGTLLDHDSYSHDPALPALDRLQALGVPVILASSKTAAEISDIRSALGLSAYPAIVENGAGLLARHPDSGNDRYVALRGTLAQMPEARDFQGFADLGPEGIARVTGLPPEAARLAGQRQFSEPGVWMGTPAEQDVFVDALQQHGIRARHGGRFLTLSFGGTKADRMAEISARYGTPPSIALGDAPNDVEMLTAADIGVIVANPVGTPLPRLPGEETGSIRRTDAAGPAGWNAAVLDILAQRGLAH